MDVEGGESGRVGDESGVDNPVICWFITADNYS